MGPIVIEPTVIINIPRTGIATTAARLKSGVGVVMTRRRLGMRVFAAAKPGRATVRVLLCGQGSNGAVDGAAYVDSFLADCPGVGIIP